MTVEPHDQAGVRGFVLKAMRCWWRLAAIATLVSLFAFPFYKGMPLGLVPVVVGLLLAGAPLLLRQTAFNRLRGLLQESSPSRWLLSVLLFGTALRLLAVAFAPTPVGDHWGYFSVGESVARGDGFGNSITFPPGQPAVVAFAIRLFGNDFHVLAGFHAALGLLTVVALYLGLRRHSEQAARWSSLVAAVWPSLVLWNTTLGHETITGLVFTMILLVFFSTEVSKRFPWAALVFIGVLTGGLALVRPTALAIPFLAGLTWWLQRNSLQRAAAAATIIFVAMTAVISPWALRNQAKFGEFCPISANFGNVFLSANHPGSDGIFYQGMEPLADLKPCERDSLRARQALKAIADDPLRTVALSAKRIAFMWGTDTSGLGFFLGDILGDPPRGGARAKNALSFLLQVPWAALGIAWCVAAWRGNREVLIKPVDWTFVLLWVAVLWFLHAFVEPLSRHHLALVPILAAMIFPDYWAAICEWRAQREDALTATDRSG